MGLWRDIQKERDKAIKILEKQARPLEGKDLDGVLATSLENLDYGKQLGELLRTIGQDGFISVEDNWMTKYGIDTEVTQGMRFLGKYASSYLTNSPSQKEAIWEDTHVLVTNHRIEVPNQIEPLFKEFAAAGHKRLVVVGGFSEGTDAFGKGFIASISKIVETYAQTKNEGFIRVLAIKAPNLTSEHFRS